MSYDSTDQSKFCTPMHTECRQDGCEKTGYQYADICVPIELKPDAVIGKITVECCGEPDVECKEHSCGKSCGIVVIQKVNIRIPINYKITACIGESVLNCENDDSL